jgi:hypothetical protein
VTTFPAAIIVDGVLRHGDGGRRTLEGFLGCFLMHFHMNTSHHVFHSQWFIDNKDSVFH